MNSASLLRRIIPLVLLLFAAEAGVSQESALDAYPVPPVSLPPLERPTIEVNKEAVLLKTAGRFPERDGEFFHLSLTDDRKIISSQDSVRKIVDMFLQAVKWQQGAEALKAEKPVIRPAAEDKALEDMIKESTTESKRKLEGEFNKLNQATEDAIQEQAELARRNAKAQVTIHQFDQYYKEIPIENTYLRVVWQEGKGVTSMRGRVFNIIRIANQRVLSADQAAEKAIQHIRKYTKLGDQAKPEAQLVILPYGKDFRYAWKLIVQTEEGQYQIWIDSQSGEVLQLVPMFASDNAKGLIFNPDPLGTTEERGFEVNAPSGGNYRLAYTGKLDVTNSGADGVCSGDLTIADPGTGEADFNISPHNGTVVERTNLTGYNCRFQDINAYAWIYNHIDTFNDLLGSSTLPDISVTVNHSNPCGLGINNACASWGSWSLTFGIGNATISNSTSCNDLFNGALDATVLTHEFGHLVNHTNNTGTMPLHIDEGMADFWAYTMINTDTFGRFWGSNCAAPSQAGWIPRQVEALDVFPEHRALSTSGYGDGQMLGWALWNVRREFNESSALGTFLMNSNLLDAFSVASFANGTSDKQVHDNFLNLEEELASLFTSSSNIHKVLSGFARAGFFLAPSDAIVDINDDYLNRNDAAGPTFTVWTGRDYTFSGVSAVTTNPPFNTRYEIEVANDVSFTTNLRSSGVQSGVTSSDGGKATWTLPTADWNAVKGGDRLYYRVTTTNNSGGNIRQSANPGNSYFTGVPTAYAVINESGECECSCGASAKTPKAATAVTLVPIIFGLVWMIRLGRKKK